MLGMQSVIKRFATADDGATSIEYALLASILAIAVLAAVQVIHVEVEASFENAGTAIAAGNAEAP